MTSSNDAVDPALAHVADALRQAESSGVAIAPPASTHPHFTVQDAYRIQALNIQRRRDAGERAVGRKVGLTSLSMQRQLGVDQPDFGVITDAMVVGNGGQLALGPLIAPRVEAEFIFRFGEDVPVSPEPDRLAAAIDGVAVAMEIIDSRVADWKIGLIDTVADNASSARIVYGDIEVATPALLGSLPEVTLTMTRDGSEVGSGPGSAVLGDPLVALHWLATAVGGYGEHFSAGDLVLAGAVAAAVPLSAGSLWSVTATGFPTVSFTSI